MQRVLIGVALVLGVVGIAQADVLIYDNSGPTVNTGLSVHSVTNTTGAQTSEVADDFLLASAMSVTRIDPQYFFGGAFTVGQWNVRIYDDNAGVPGTELLATTAPGASYASTIGLPDQVLDLALATPFAAAAGTRYWISLQAALDPAQALGIRWREIVAADPTAVHGRVGYWRGTPIFGGLTADWTWEKVGQKNGAQYADVAEMQFTLYGVPEPTGLLLLGLGGLLGLLRRR